MEEGLPAKRRPSALELIEAVGEDRSCLSYRHREHLLTKHDQGGSGSVLRLGERVGRCKASATDLFDRPVQLLEQRGIH
jgi:hypothetical protein